MIAMNWHVVHTQPLKEGLASENLRAQGFDVYLPRFRKTRRHARHIDTVISPLFPRYLFVGFDSEVQAWRQIRSTRGVHELVCHGEQPAIVPANVVDEIRAREDSTGLVRLGEASHLSRGDRVEIVAGAFCEQVGLFERLTGHDRVIVLLSLLGRAVNVTVPLEAIRNCS